MAHDMYADELTLLKHGYPLWDPDTGGEPEVEIADVGYVRFGRFHRLFNASLEPGHESNRDCGEPDGYEPVYVGKIVRRSPHRPGTICSRTISRRGADIAVSGSVIEAGVAFQFESSKDRGAILILNAKAERQDIRGKDIFKSYLLKHYKSWLNLANNEHNGCGISLSDLIFVTGCDKTADWAVATWSGTTLSGRLSFQAGFSPLAGANVTVWGSWAPHSTAHSNCGPEMPYVSFPTTAVQSAQTVRHPVCAADLQTYTQCIFLRGFRVLERNLWRKVGLRLKNSWGGIEEVSGPWFQRSSPRGEQGSMKSPTRDASNSNGTGAHDEQLHLSDDGALESVGPDDIEVVSNEQRTQAPLETLLERILEDTDVAVAVAHDDDLAMILDASDDSLDVYASIDAVPIHINLEANGVGTIRHITDISTPDKVSQIPNLESQTTVLRTSSVSNSTHTFLKTNPAKPDSRSLLSTESIDTWSVAVIGDGGVGKTALAIQFVSRVFPEGYEPTIEDAYRTHMTVDSKTCSLEILDTAGQEEYAALREHAFQSVQAFVLVYSITSRSTFNRLNIFWEPMFRIKGYNPIFILVGNKSDQVAEREVSKEEGDEFAKRLGCAFLETSAKTSLHVEALFTDIVRLLRNGKETPPVGTTETRPTRGTSSGCVMT